jgi:short-subunit dehydrogenase
VLLASLVGRQGTPGAAHYAATKAYVQTLAEALHAELAPTGIDVVASAPGPVHSGFAARAGMRMTAALDPADVAAATLEALGRRAVVTPGALSKLLTWVTAAPAQAGPGAGDGRRDGTHDQPPSTGPHR